RVIGVGRPRVLFIVAPLTGNTGKEMIRHAHLIGTTAIVSLAMYGAAPAWAANFSVSPGQTQTTAQTLGSGSGQTGSAAATGTLSVSGGTVAVTISGNNATLNNLGTITQTGTGRAIRDNTGVSNLIVNNGSVSNATATIQAADADVI